MSPWLEIALQRRDRGQMSRGSVDSTIDLKSCYRKRNVVRRNMDSNGVARRDVEKLGRYLHPHRARLIATLNRRRRECLHEFVSYRDGRRFLSHVRFQESPVKSSCPLLRRGLGGCQERQSHGFEERRASHAHSVVSYMTTPAGSLPNGLSVSCVAPRRP